jgi:hypothetical protein
MRIGGWLVAEWRPGSRLDQTCGQVAGSGMRRSLAPHHGSVKDAGSQQGARLHDFSHEE